MHQNTGNVTEIRHDMQTPRYLLGVWLISKGVVELFHVMHAPGHGYAMLNRPRELRLHRQSCLRSDLSTSLKKEHQMQREQGCRRGMGEGEWAGRKGLLVARWSWGESRLQLKERWKVCNLTQA